MTEELIAATNKKNGEDRLVPGADRLLAPGPDKAGDLGRAALLPAPDGAPLLEEGASYDERKPRLLRRIGGYVAGLASRLAERTGWRGWFLGRVGLLAVGGWSGCFLWFG